jgi:hypothetical protein
MTFLQWLKCACYYSTRISVRRRREPAIPQIRYARNPVEKKEKGKSRVVILIVIKMRDAAEKVLFSHRGLLRGSLRILTR